MSRTERSVPQTSSAAPRAAPISKVHSIGAYGLLHAGTLPEHSLERLRHECACTSCDMIHPDGRALFDPQTLSLLQQGCHAHATAWVKLPDGYLGYAPTAGNRVLCVLKDSLMCQPAGTDPSDAPPLAPDGARSVFYSVVIPPGQERTTKPFRLVFHNGFTEAHEISRFSNADHAIAQLAAPMPHSAELPLRAIAESPLIGSLIGQLLSGTQADLIKRTFLSLVQQAGSAGHDIYDVPVDTSALMAKMLQLHCAEMRLSLCRCRDGILAYRPRADGHKTFLFVASSDDFFRSKPADRSVSSLQLYKLSYKDTSDNGLRIFIRVAGADEPPGPFSNDEAVCPLCPFGAPWCCCCYTLFFLFLFLFLLYYCQSFNPYYYYCCFFVLFWAGSCHSATRSRMCSTSSRSPCADRWRSPPTATSFRMCACRRPLRAPTTTSRSLRSCSRRRTACFSRHPPPRRRPLKIILLPLNKEHHHHHHHHQ